jgi:hypothetical protein
LQAFQRHPKVNAWHSSFDAANNPSGMLALAVDVSNRIRHSAKLTQCRLKIINCQSSPRDAKLRPELPAKESLHSAVKTG